MNLGKLKKKKKRKKLPFTYQKNPELNFSNTGKKKFKGLFFSNL